MYLMTSHSSHYGLSIKRQKYININYITYSNFEHKENISLLIRRIENFDNF